MTKEQRLIKQYQAVRIAKMGFAVVIFACIAWMAMIPSVLVERDFEGEVTPKIVREASRFFQSNAGDVSKFLHELAHTFLINFVVLIGAALLLDLCHLAQRRLRNKIGESLAADCSSDVFTNENGQHDTLLRLKPDSPWRDLVLPDRTHDWSRERFEGAPGMSKQEAMAYDVERHQEIIERGVQEQGFYSAPFKMKDLPSTRPFEPVLPGLTAITSANENEK